MKKLLTIIVLLTGLFWLYSCDPDSLYEDYYTTEPTGWHKDSIARFSFQVTNTQNPVNLLINIRNLGNYPYSNIWFFVDIVAPDQTTIRDTVEYQLALPGGKWVGKGNNVYSNQFVFRKNVYFPMAGEFSVLIQQAMRDDLLKGIRDIGVRVEKRN